MLNKLSKDGCISNFQLICIQRSFDYQTKWWWPLMPKLWWTRSQLLETDISQSNKDERRQHNDNFFLWLLQVHEGCIPQFNLCGRLKKKKGVILRMYVNHLWFDTFKLAFGIALSKLMSLI